MCCAKWWGRKDISGFYQCFTLLVRVDAPVCVVHLSIQVCTCTCWEVRDILSAVISFLFLSIMASGAQTLDQWDKCPYPANRLTDPLFTTFPFELFIFQLKLSYAASAMQGCSWQFRSTLLGASFIITSVFGGCELQVQRSRLTGVSVLSRTKCHCVSPHSHQFG